MPRYELSEGTSNKFWEIELEGSSFTTRYGRIGTDGQSTTKDFKSPADAKKAYDKLVQEKVNKGYELVGDEGDEGGDEDDDGEAVEGASNRALEAAILEDPDKVEGYLVYADWLQTQDDPRGELMAVEAALAASPGDAKLKARNEELLAEHAEALLGDLAEEEHFHPTWELGGIRAATISDPDEEYAELSGEAAAEMVSKLFKLPAARFLLHPALGLLRSRHAVVSLWAAHQTGDVAAALAQVAVEDAENALVLRVGLEVDIVRIADAAAIFIMNLQQGVAFGAAAGQALAVEPEFDLAATLGLLIRGGALCSASFSRSAA